MTKYASEDVTIFHVGGYNLVGPSTVLEIGKEAEVKDTTGFGTAWRTYAATGLKMGSLTQNGFFDDATQSVHEAFLAQSGLSKVGMICLEGGEVGDHFTGFAGALQVGYERKVSVGEWHSGNAKYQSNGEVEDGVLVKALAAVTANGDSESSDVHDAAASSDGGSAYIEVESITLGTATALAVKLRHSDDGVTWSDVSGGAFTAVTAKGAQRIAITGTGSIKQYVAAAWSWTGGAGGGSTATFTVGVTRAENN